MGGAVVVGAGVGRGASVGVATGEVLLSLSHGLVESGVVCWPPDPEPPPLLFPPSPPPVPPLPLPPSEVP